MAAISVASVQSGSATITSGSGTTIDITISSVTTANSIVMYTSRNDDIERRLKRHTFIGSLTSSTNLRFVRHESASAKTVELEWTVLEFNSGVLASLQTGIVDRTNLDEDVTISAVDLSKTFVITHLQTSQNNLSSYVACTSELTSTTNLRLSSTSTPSAGYSKIGYQIVEFAADADVNVQSGIVSVPALSESANLTISAVDLSKTFVVNGGVTGASSYTDTRNLGRLRLTSTTNLEASRTTSGSSEITYFSYYVVELEGSGHSVESFDSVIADTATVPAVQPSWTALSTDKTAIMAGWNPGNSRSENASPSDYPTHGFISAKLNAGADGVTLARIGTNGEMQTTGYAVDFTAGGADVTAPTWSVAPAVTAITATGADIDATINETGDIFWVVVAQGDTAPSVSEVIAGQESGGGAPIDSGSALAGTVLDDVIAGLTESTAYTAYLVARDDEGTPNVQATVTDVDFSTTSAADTTPPTFSVAPAVTAIAATGADIDATINETGDIYFVVVAQADPAPTTTEVIAGQASGGGAPVDSGSALAGTVLNDVIAGLTESTAYTAYVVARDDEGTPNVQAAVTSVNFSTIAAADVTPPTFSVGPTVSSITSTGCTVSATINETGDIYWVIVAQVDTAPTVTEVIAGQASGGGAPLDAGSALAGTTLSEVAAGLTASTAYTAYFVARDDEGTPNVQAAVTDVDFSTTATSGTLTIPIVTAAGIAAGTATGINIAVMSTGLATLVYSTGAAAINGSGNIVITDASIVPATAYDVVFDDGTYTKACRITSE